MKLSARNPMKGRVWSVQRGTVMTVVKVEVQAPAVIFASITNEGADDLALKAGDGALVIVKSSEVIVGKE
jgi:molybdopterin-binding protein